MARRHRHNKGGGRQPSQKMLDMGREDYFRYDAEQILNQAPLDEDHQKAFLQQIVARGSRQGIDEARDFIREKCDEEGLIDADARDQLIRLVGRYSTYR
ncbi:MAG: hypothetical protein R3185_05810 [Candidatus Thermoplasmatota archaeon]|nr:hypothetical protein [Candidatus Thermoplasmatota archaeon]